MKNADSLQEGKPVPNFPFLIEATQKYTSLSELLKTRPELFWKEAVKLAETPVRGADFPEKISHPLIAKAGLAIRAIDRGMIDLPIDKRIVYLYNYLAADPHMYIPFRKVEDVVDISQIFPFANATQIEIVKQRASENGRYHRFERYMQALQELQAAERPDILLGSVMKSSDGIYESTGGIYSEFDFWVEEKIKEAITCGKMISNIELVRLIPLEFAIFFNLSIAQRSLLVTNTIKLVTGNYNRAPTNLIEAAQLTRFAILESLLTKVDGGYILSGTLDELAEKLRATHRIAEITVRLYSHKKGVNISVRQGRLTSPTPETVLLTKYILEAHDVLDEPGKRWTYKQLTTADIAWHIHAHHPELGIVTPTMIKSIIGNYLDISAINQFEGIPSRRLASRDPKSIHNAIKHDIFELIKQGHSQDVDTIIDTLKITTKRPRNLRVTVRHMLHELHEEGKI